MNGVVVRGWRIGHVAEATSWVNRLYALRVELQKVLETFGRIDSQRE
jgi:hypothetical protein